MEIVQIALRTLLGFVVLLLLTRIMGRKQIAEITFFDYITGISIGTIAGTMTADTSVSILPSIYALIFWTILTLLTGTLTRISVPARKLIDSEPVMVIRDGQILEDALHNRKYNLNTLLMQLREKEVFDPSDVMIGIIETDGKLSIQKVANQKPTPSVSAHSIYQNKEFIIDGVIQYDNLSEAGLSPEWLINELQIQNITDPSDVTIAMLTPRGTLYTDKTKDNITDPK